MNKRLLYLYSLTFNPFSSQLPATALWVTPQVQSFCCRMEHQIGEGGFALAVGEPGVGKSAALRILSEQLGRPKPDVQEPGKVIRPQLMLEDGFPVFYF
jgi:hypothetical protein